MKRSLPFHSNQVWPPTVWAGLFIVLYGMVAVCFWLIGLSVENSVRTVFDTDEAGQILRIRTALLAGAAGIYALYRLWRFHPACNQAYAAWLKLSPWTANKPLPIGPVHLVWQDAAVVGVLAATAFWHAHADPAVPVAVFSLVYLGGLTLLLALTHQRRSCVLLGFLWPALMLPDIGGPVFIALALAIIAVVWHGQRQSMRAFPWKFLAKANRPAKPLWETEIRLESIGGPSAAGTQFNLGWPIMALSPKVQPPSVSPWTCIAMGTLAGWWCFCIVESSGMDPEPELILLVAIFAAAIRLGFYCSNVVAPFNLWGRIRWGKLVVPGFDKVYLTPIAVIVAAILGSILIKHSGSWYPAAEGCVVAVIWYVLFGGGPTLRSWALTGQHRLRPPARSNAKQRLRAV